MPGKHPSIYIMTNFTNNVLYTGVTSNLPIRVHQHRSKANKGFTSQYNCNELVYFELFADMESAITREKQIKSGSRQRKVALIDSSNPAWRDLYEDICR